MNADAAVLHWLFGHARQLRSRCPQHMDAELSLKWPETTGHPSDWLLETGFGKAFKRDCHHG